MITEKQAIKIFSVYFGVPKIPRIYETESEWIAGVPIRGNKYTGQGIAIGKFTGNMRIIILGINQDAEYLKSACSHKV